MIIGEEIKYISMKCFVKCQTRLVEQAGTITSRVMSGILSFKRN